jgi:lipoprotein-anchoring transpeptidase ErfK/SrfK
VPTLQKSSSGRSAFGDFLAVLLLLAILGGLGWLWWQSKHPKKKSAPKITAIAKPKTVASPPIAAKPSAPVVVVPPVVSLLRSNPGTVVLPVPRTNPPVVVPVKSATEFPRPVRDLFEAQVALADWGISAGSIDGAIGSQTRAALAAFQRVHGLPVTSALDAATRTVLTLDIPPVTNYVVTINDLARLQPIGATWLAKSQQSALDYETILELVAEKSHAHPLQIQKLNPGVNWTNVIAGTALKVPAAVYPEAPERAALVVIHLSEKFLEAFDTETNLLLHCPCSIAARVEKRPVGELHVAVVAPDPNYTFDPAVFPESAEAQAIGHKIILPPGPNNPVGVAWVGLDKPGYGIHGTPGPEQVGRTESHGCFRLANWNAAYFLKLAWTGLPVQVVP